MSDAKKNLLLFFDRPLEPCYVQKGDDKAVFQIPDEYYPKQLQPLKTIITNRFCTDVSRIIPVRKITLPNLDVAMKLNYNDQFTLFIPSHRIMAANLIDSFLKMPDIESLLSLCAYCQLRINPYMFNYCLSVAIMHRPDTKGFNFPTLTEIFPDKFMDPKVFEKAREICNVFPPGNRIPVVIPVNYTANDTEPEHRLAYFREDIGINLHHWHWHLVYPFASANLSIVDKDRRGELFYYMHQQIIARYNMERLCNDLKRVIPFLIFKEPITEGYFPKLNSKVASRVWPPRSSGATLKDLNRPVEQLTYEVSQLDIWRDRFIHAVESLFVKMPDGSHKALDEEKGIDILGNMMESSIMSPNREYYGDLHNMGHNFIGYIQDPDNRHLEFNGVMGDSATAMRDPVFYRWHSFIDKLFQLYKYKLNPYTDDKLDFAGICVSSISLEGDAGTNTIDTFWQQSTVDLKRGLDFTPSGSMPVKFTHLQHKVFNYVIQVNNTSGHDAKGTVRIFMAPTVDENGEPLLFDAQRRAMIELDKFTAELCPGNNTIHRRSVDSSVTIPYERTFPDPSVEHDSGSQDDAEFDFCGCGWPQHLLVPKGTEHGYPVVLFAMVSNWEDDKVEQDEACPCTKGSSYCGIRDRKYPDRRAMGYPFDRPSRHAFLSDFLKPNMAVQNCSIRFTDITIPRE